MLIAADPSGFLGEQLDACARWILYYCNLRVALVAAFAVTITCLAISLFRRESEPPFGRILRLLLGVTTFWSGLTVMAALALSAKPRFDALSNNDWCIVGAISGFALVGVAVDTFYSEYKRV